MVHFCDRDKFKKINELCIQQIITKMIYLQQSLPHGYCFIRFSVLYKALLVVRTEIQTRSPVKCI